MGPLTGDSEKSVHHKGSMFDPVVQSVHNSCNDVWQAETPKHLLLPHVVKTLTGNADVIQTLNILGHWMLYSQLEENDTALSLQKLAATMNQKVVLPASIQPSVFTNLA